MSIELKIKASSLAAESRIIKQNVQRLKRESERARDDIYISCDAKARSRLVNRQRQISSIRLHLIQRVRPEARATHLARMFLKNRPYKSVELVRHPDRKSPDWSLVENMAVRYGNSKDPRDVAQRLTEWAGL